MHEIEIKAKVNNLNEVKDKLEKLGCHFSDPLIQKDFVYWEEGVDYDHIRPGANFCRIRETGGRIIFTLKQRRSNQLDCIEKEVVIDNTQAMIDILKLMKFYEMLQMSKTRTKCQYNDYEICLDQVEGLGDFIEVEKMSDDDGETVQEELKDFLIGLKISPDNIITKGYDSLIHERNLNNGKS